MHHIFLRAAQRTRSAGRAAPRAVLPAVTALSLFCTLHCFGQTAVAHTDILGRPTATSITISVLFDQQAQVYFQYGTTPGVYSASTATRDAAAGQPVVVVVDHLAPDTRYYYRTCSKRPSDAYFLNGEEHTFHTQRASGSTFCFTIEADPHPYDKKGCHRLWDIALDNQRKDSADFLLDLGDTFGDDHNPTITSEEMRQLHLDDRPFFGRVCHSSPLFFCLGNHEGESGYYLLQAPPDNLGVYGTLWRQFYYPNPLPDGFYSGNTTQEAFGIGLPENYYAWEWGDALFVVMDAYRGYAADAKPRKWDWTLGKAQYDCETRGGTATAALYEWGGYEADGRTWSFEANRPGWGLPIHQLMVKNGVNIYFQGHDHLFAKEQLDGIVYQEVPMPSDSTYIIGTRDNGDAYTDLKMDASGHLRVTVSPERVTVDYVRAWLPADETADHKNGEVAYTYSVTTNTTDAESGDGMPAEPALEQNSPNPFAATTALCYSLRDAGPVSLKVYDVLGKEARTLVSASQNTGKHAVAFDAGGLPPGLYFYQLRVHGAVLTKKAVLAR